ncbi:MAG: hypothetical protein ACLGHL_09290, partial [Actinomycetota bacterium]
VTIFAEVVNGITAYSLRPGEKIGQIDVREESRPLPEVVAEALASLTSIAGKLDSSVTSARQSTDRLDALGARLRRSLVLARSIADELKELDESMGPSTGGGP